MDNEEDQFVQSLQKVELHMDLKLSFSRNKKVCRASLANTAFEVDPSASGLTRERVSLEVAACSENPTRRLCPSQQLPHHRPTPELERASSEVLWLFPRGHGRVPLVPPCLEGGQLKLVWLEGKTLK